MSWNERGVRAHERGAREDEREARERVARTEELLSAVDGLAPAAAREQALDALHAVAELYGECLARVMRRVDDAARAAIAGDELVSHLLLVHELHPESAGERVRRALADVRGVTVLAADEAEVRVRIAAPGCGTPPAEQLARTVRETIAWAAPEVPRVETERPAPEPALIPVDSLFRDDAVQAAGTR